MYKTDMNYSLSLMQRFLLALLLIGLGVTAVFVSHANAAVVRSSEAVSVAQDEIVSGDFYAIGGDVTISGTVEGDVYVMGGTLTINGIVEGDILAIGGTVAVHGAVGDDLRAVGGKVVVAQTVGGDVVTFGGALATLSTAHIDGEVLFYGGAATVAGEVEGAVHARAEALTIDGKVGAVDAVLSGDLTLTNAASVAGNVSYEGSGELSRTPETVIEGEVMQRDRMNVEARVSDFMPFGLMILFAVLVAVFFLRERLLRMVRTTSTRKHALWLPAAIGFGILFLTPLAFALLMASVLGLVVGGLLLVVYLGFIIFGMIVMHIVLGAFIAKYTVKEYRISWPFAIIGVIAVQILLLIPIIGPLAIFALFLSTLGMIGITLFDRVRN